MTDTADTPDGPIAVLLDLQAHDTQIDQLRHRRATLSARATLAEAEAALSRLAVEVSTVQARRDELGRDQKRIEDEVAAIEAKTEHENATLYSGTVTSPRALQDLQAEIESLHRRQSTLEDEIIELMEQIEPLDADLERLAADVAAQEAAAEAARVEITTGEAEIDVVLDQAQAERDALAATVEPGLLAEYEQLRSSFGGVGVARLEGGRCGGCQLTLSAVERDRIKNLPPDSLVHCEECGRLLVR
jgi:predicted  nucleic acid-binding Zn-ribbon protein